VEVDGWRFVYLALFLVCVNVLVAVALWRTFVVLFVICLPISNSFYIFAQ